jgi:DNA-binding transcriptional LysR family regulator
VLRRLDTSTEVNGLVRFTAARALAEGFIIARLGEFHKRYPDLNLELIGDARVMSLAKREADIALRLGVSKDSDLIARRVGKISFGFYASAEYRDRLANDEESVFIGYDEDSDFIFEASWLARQFASKRFTFRTNSQTAQAGAARAGYGIALLPKYLAANDPSLVRISLAESIPDRDVWLLMRHELKSVPRIRAVADYFVEMFHRERHILGDE